MRSPPSTVARTRLILSCLMLGRRVWEGRSRAGMVVSSRHSEPDTRQRDLGCGQEGRSQSGPRNEGVGNSPTSARPPNLLTRSRHWNSELDGQI